MLPSQDHKRVGEGDTGPNTGGMGAYAPVSLSTPELLSDILDRIIRPTLAALAEDDSEFRGLLYAGLMLTEEGPRVVEFNCRFGDPETQVVLPLLESSLLDPMLEVARGGRLGGAALEWSGGAALTTVVASEGYPGDYGKGRSIEIPDRLNSDPDVLLFHAGTRLGSDGLETSGGRVIAATGLGSTLSQAAAKSRKAAAAIEFEGKQFRTDIGWREFARSERRTTLGSRTSIPCRNSQRSRPSSAASGRTWWTARSVASASCSPMSCASLHGAFLPD